MKEKVKPKMVIINPEAIPAASIKITEILYQLYVKNETSKEKGNKNPALKDRIEHVMKI